MSDHDIISNPSHYTSGRKFQPLDIILEWFPDDYLLGQTLKYLSRIGRKGDPLEDAMKMRFYLDKKIELLKRESNSRAMPLDLSNPNE